MRMDRTSGKPLVEAQMISLADIAFLIIFFFMMTASFMTDKLKVDLPQAAKTSKTETSISVVLDSQGRMTVNGEKVLDRNDLESRLRDMLHGKKTAAECEVRFKCDKAARYKDYSPVYEAISNAGGVIAIMHELPR